MGRFSLSAFCFLLFTVACLCQNFQPQQLHLALGDDLSRMVAIWATADPLPSSQGVSCVVGLQSNSYNLTFGGNSYTYPDGGFKGQMHKVTMKGLKPNTKYFYRCGSSNSFSKVRLSEDESADVMSSEFVFKTAPEVSDSASFTAAVIGDMGVKNSNGTFTRLTEDRKANLLDMLVHVGDISYADDYHPSSTNSRIEDEYFQRLQTIAAYFPAMTTVGNHEKQFDFAAYLNRTYMPTISSGSRFWYSFDYLHAHFVAFSTEHPFHPGSVQYNWLKADIEKAAKNRHNVPWIIVFAHRPLYCSALLEAERCTVEAPRYRKYLEDIFHENQVDLYLCGHNHNYERSFPVYKEHATSTDPHTYVNPKATIYIVDGAAGNIELNDPTWMPDIKWRAAHSKGFEFGYARMTITKTSLEWTFFNDKDKSITDQFTIQKV